MIKKYALLDVAFIVGTAIALLVLNEFGQMDVIKTYAVPVFYGCYLMGRISFKLANKENSKQELKLKNSIEK